MIADFFSSAWATLKTFQLKDAIDIILVAFIIYYIFRLIRQTRSAQVVKGLAILLAAYILSTLFDLTMLSSLLRMIFEFAVIIIVIIFQPEIRKILENLGRRNFTKEYFKNFVSTGINEPDELMLKTIDEVVNCCEYFSRNKIGALIAFERETILTDIAESGTILNCDTSQTALANIFYKGAPLHDGACIIRDARIYSAGCILPLTGRTELGAEYGTRHRAAVGLSDESDAVVVVVSEESGYISLVVRGSLETKYERTRLHNDLCDLLLKNPRKKQGLLNLFKKKEASK